MQSIGIDSSLDSEDRVAFLKMRIEKFKKDHAILWTKSYPYKTQQVLHTEEETVSQSKKETPYMSLLKANLVPQKS